MAVLQVAVIAFALYFLLHFYVLPRLYRQLPTTGVNNGYSRILSVLFAETAHAAALVVGLSLATVSLAVWLLSQLSGHISQAQLGRALEFVRELRERIDTVSVWWGFGSVAFLCALLWLSLKSEAKRQFATAVTAAVEKLKAEFEAGKVADLPPTEEMMAADAAIEVRKKQIAAIIDRAHAVGGNAAMADPKQNSELARLLEETEALVKFRFDNDVRRRLALGPQISDGEQPSRNIFLSRGFFRLVTGTTRALSLLSLVLLAPALVAVTGPRLSEAASEASIALRNLILESSVAEAQASFEKALGRADKEQQLDAQDQELIDQLAQQYSQQLHHQFDNVVHVPVDVLRSVSQYSVREKILHDFAAEHSAAGDTLHLPAGQTAEQRALADAVVAAQSNAPRAEGLTEQFRRDLTAHAKTAEPREWKNFRDKAVAALKSLPGETVRSEKVATQLFSELLNVAGRTLGATSADSTALHLLAENLIEPGELMEHFHEINRLNQYRFLNEIVAHGDINAAPPTTIASNVPLYGEQERAQLRKAVAGFEDKLAGVNRAWADHPPSLPTPPHGGQNLADARREIRELFNGSMRPALREAQCRKHSPPTPITSPAFWARKDRRRAPD
jgi:hypothetical protein